MKTVPVGGHSDPLAFDGDVGAVAQSDADFGRRQRWRSIDAIVRHGHDSTFSVQLFDCRAPVWRML
jgi:hypothetical protein